MCMNYYITNTILVKHLVLHFGIYKQKTFFFDFDTLL